MEPTEQEPDESEPVATHVIPLAGTIVVTSTPPEGT
jgi:hypothetical protein